MAKDIKALAGADKTDFESLIRTIANTATGRILPYTVSAYLTADLSVASGTNTDVTWTAKEADEANNFTPSSAGFTVPSGTAYARVLFRGRWGGASSAGARYSWVSERLADGTTVVKELGRQFRTGILNAHVDQDTGWRPVTPGNKLFVTVNQASGAALPLIGGGAGPALPGDSAFVQVQFASGLSDVSGGSLNYSTVDTNTGRTWINGKPIYRKVIDLGNLPNTTTKTVAHGISGITEIIDARGMAKNPTGPVWYPLTLTSTTGLGSQIMLSADGTNVTITTGSDRSTFTGYAILEYTK